MGGRAERQGGTMAFLGWFVHYLLIFVILAVVAGLGVFAGKKLSDRSAANKAAETGKSEEIK